MLFKKVLLCFKSESNELYSKLLLDKNNNDLNDTFKKLQELNTISEVIFLCNEFIFQSKNMITLVGKHINNDEFNPKNIFFNYITFDELYNELLKNKCFDFQYVFIQGTKFKFKPEWCDHPKEADMIFEVVEDRDDRILYKVFGDNRLLTPQSVCSKSYIKEIVK